MALEQEGASKALPRSAHEPEDPRREHALRALEQREAEREEAKHELDWVRKHYYDASLHGGDVSTAERLLQVAEKTYKAEKRYREVKEEAKRSTRAGGTRAAHTALLSCFLCPQRRPCVCTPSHCRRLLLASSRPWRHVHLLRPSLSVCRPHDLYSSGCARA
jgi:hypothetical protein